MRIWMAYNRIQSLMPLYQEPRRKKSSNILCVTFVHLSWLLVLVVCSLARCTDKKRVLDKIKAIVEGMCWCLRTVGWPNQPLVIFKSTQNCVWWQMETIFHTLCKDPINPQTLLLDTLVKFGDLTLRPDWLRPRFFRLLQIVCCLHRLH